jgi:hypothetical protein
VAQIEHVASRHTVFRKAEVLSTARLRRNLNVKSAGKNDINRAQSNPSFNTNPKLDST